MWEKEIGGQPNVVQDGKGKSDEDFAAGLPKGMTELKDLQGHLDCISGLAVGGVNSKFIFNYYYFYQSYFMIPIFECLGDKILRTIVLGHKNKSYFHFAIESGWKFA